MNVEYRKFVCACLDPSLFECTSHSTPIISLVLIFLDIVLSQETIWSSLPTVMWVKVFLDPKLWNSEKFIEPICFNYVQM